MRHRLLGSIALAGLVATPALAEVPVSLRGSPASMTRQNSVAHEHQLAFARTPAELRGLEQEGALVRLDGNADYEVANFVSYPLARPEMRTFIERLAAQYHAATGEKLVVTSLSRPSSRQPGNSHALSVHPTGIAVDLRVSQRAKSREWIESTLLSLEELGLLDVTRERNPPHYHVALFPAAYMAHVKELQLQELERSSALAKLAAANAASSVSAFVPTEELRGEPSEPATPASAWLAAMVLPAAWLTLLYRRRRRGSDSDW